jgi:hypothetical protein
MHLLSTFAVHARIGTRWLETNSGTYTTFFEAIAKKMKQSVKAAEPSLHSLTCLSFCRNVMRITDLFGAVELTEVGTQWAIHLLSMAGKREEAASYDQFWTGEMWGSYVLQALHCLVMFTLDVDYTIAHDPETGRRQTILLDKGTGMCARAQTVLMHVVAFAAPWN